MNCQNQGISFSVIIQPQAKPDVPKRHPSGLLKFCSGERDYAAKYLVIRAAEPQPCTWYLGEVSLGWRLPPQHDIFLGSLTFWLLLDLSLYAFC